MSSRSKTIWFFRHCESLANAKGVTSDPASVPLTKAGLAQAERIVEHFLAAPDLIVTSPYIRTVETARPLRRRYPATPCEEWPVHEFTYISPSRCMNTTMVDRKPLVDRYWQLADPDHCDGPGAESFNAFLARARSAIALLRARKESVIALFTHGQFICAVKWILDQEARAVKGPDMAEFRNFISALAPKNGEKIEVSL